MTWSVSPPQPPQGGSPVHQAARENGANAEPLAGMRCSRSSKETDEDRTAAAALALVGLNQVTTPARRDWAKHPRYRPLQGRHGPHRRRGQRRWFVKPSSSSATARAPTSRARQGDDGWSEKTAGQVRASRARPTASRAPTRSFRAPTPLAPPGLSRRMSPPAPSERAPPPHAFSPIRASLQGRTSDSGRFSPRSHRVSC